MTNIYVGAKILSKIEIKLYHSDSQEEEQQKTRSEFVFFFFVNILWENDLWSLMSFGCG